MYSKKGSYSMNKASGMLLLLCFFYNAHAQLYIGIDGWLNIKNSIFFQSARKNSSVLLFIRDITTSHNEDQISNIIVFVLSSLILKKLSQGSFTQTIKKTKNIQIDKKILKLVSKRECSISKNKNSVIISNKKSGNIAIIITNTFRETQAILRNRYKIFAVYEDFYSKQSFKGKLFEKSFLIGIRIRIRSPPASYAHALQ